MRSSRWSALPVESAAAYEIDWTRRLGSATLESVSYRADPQGELSFSGAEIDGNISRVTIHAGRSVWDYRIVCTPTIDGATLPPVTIHLSVVRHLPAGTRTRNRITLTR